MAIVPISKTITPITNIPDRATMALATFDQNATLFADQIKAMGLDLGTWAVQANTLAAAINIALNLGIGNSDFLRFVRAPGDIIHTAATSAPPGTLVCNGLPVSRTAYSDLFAALVTNAGFTSQSLQITITVPGTFTKVAHGFNGGERIRLSTTGALPTPLRTDVDYFVIPTGDATFHLSTSERTVSLVGLTGTQSGNHSYIQSIWGLGDGVSTFNLPNLFDVFYRSTSPSRTVGTYQRGTVVAGDNSYQQGYGIASAAGYGTATLSESISADPVDPAAYPLAANVWVAATGGVYPLNGAMSGAARPSNIGLLPCIVY